MQYDLALKNCLFQLMSWLLTVQLLSILPVIGLSNPQHSIKLQRPLDHRFMLQSWTTSSGIPQNSVNDIIQTKDGYIWLGTFGGLARFNGISFTVFDISNSPGLASNRILSLFEDTQGRLWIGHQDDGVSLYENGQFRSFKALKDHSVITINEDAGGVIWLGTESGLSSYTDNVIQDRPVEGIEQAFAVYDLYLTEHGKLYAGTKKGLLAYQNSEWVLDTGNTGGKAITAIYEDKLGNLWVGHPHGIYRLSVDKHSVDHIQLAKPDFIWSVFGNHEGQVFISTGNGLQSIRPGSLETTWNEIFPETFPRKVSIRSLFCDRENNLWLGTNSHGLIRFSKRIVSKHVIDENQPERSVLPVTTDGQGGLWIGYSCQGLKHFKDGEMITEEITDRGRIKCVRSLLYDTKGLLWIGHDHKISRTPDGRNIREFWANETKGWVNVIFEDRNGLIWLGLEDGLLSLKDSAGIRYTVDEGLVDNDVRTILQSKNDGLWIGTGEGLSYFDGSQFTNYTPADGLPPGMVRALHEDEEGVLWIGTYGGGLARLKDGWLTKYTTENGLFDNVVSRILEDKHSNLWMLGNMGLYFVNRSVLNDFADGVTESVYCVSFGPDDGMSEGFGGSQPAGWQTADGKMYFPTINGLAEVDVPGLHMIDLPTPIDIEKVVVAQQTIAPKQEILLKSGNRDLEIHYIGLNFTAPEKVKYQYKLEGYDDRWIDAGNRRTAYFTNLDPGSYRFHVKAMNHHGFWSDHEASCQVTVLPYWWQTWWFRSAMILTVGGLVIIIIQARLYWLNKRQAALRELVEKRTRELYEAKETSEKAYEELKEKEQQLIHSEKMASLGLLTAGIAHEINNSINVVSVGSSSLGNDFKEMMGIVDHYLDSRTGVSPGHGFDKGYKNANGEDLDMLRECITQNIEDIQIGAKRTAGIVTDLRNFSRTETTDFTTANIHQGIDSTLRILNSKLKEKFLTIDKNYDESIGEIMCYPGQLNQVFMNLLVNAQQACREEGHIAIQTRDIGDQIQIIFADDGVGMDNVTLKHVFEPFYTTKEIGEGTGLGLSIVYGIINKHHGKIEVTSQLDAGTAFTITLPKHQ